MSSFKISSKLVGVLGLICVLWVIISIQHIYFNEFLLSFLSFSLSLLLLIVIILCIKSNLEVDNNIIIKKGIFKTVAINVEDIQDITIMSLISRYVIVLVTKDKFIMISTLYNNFITIKNYLKTKKPDITNLDRLDDKSIRNKQITLYLLLLFIFCATCIYLYKRIHINFF